MLDASSLSWITHHSCLILIITVTSLISLYGFQHIRFFNRYQFHVGAILKNKQYDRLISSAFLHGDMTHLFFNMITLYSLGSILNNVDLFLIYFFSIVGGSLFSLYIHKNQFHYSAIGASAGVSGVVYAIIGMYPNIELRIFLIPIGIKGWVFSIFYMLYSIMGMQIKKGRIGHSAHIGGSLFGFLFIIIFNPSFLFINKFYIIVMMIPFGYFILKRLKILK